VRVYIVQRQGETAASIAAQPDMAQCPRCGKDLVAANPWRASVRRPNGYLDFRDPLVPGERLWVPDKWSSGELDALPKSYFDSLPDPTGLAGVPMQSQAIMLRPHPIVRYGVGDVPAAPAPSLLGQMLAKLPSYWPFVGLAAGGVMALTGVALLASGGRTVAAANPRKPGDHRYWVKLARMGRIPIWAPTIEKARRAAVAHAYAYRTEVESVEGPDDPAENPRVRRRR
jgi:hypothetical protein